MSETTQKTPDTPGTVPARITDRFQVSDLHKWHKAVDTDRKKLVRFAGLVMLFVVGFGGIWGATAKIGGAVIGSGRVIAEGRNRVVQHLEGGIIADIPVREGDRVTKGEVLARLDDTQVRTQLTAQQLQAAILRVQLARRRTEIADQSTINFPKDFPENIAKHPRLIETIDSQRSEFEALRKLRDTQIMITKGQIEGAENEAKGHAEVRKEQEKQAQLLVDELADLDILVKKELIRRSEIFARRRALADIQASIAFTQQRITTAEGQARNLANEIRQTEQTYLREANAALVDIQQRLNDVEQSIDRLVDVLDRGVIKSPVDGTIFRIGKQTLGGVIQPAESLMEIFPDGDKLTVEAFIEGKDIEQVTIGQKARVVFPSNRDGGLTPIPGEVVYISADAVVSDNSPVGYYIARVTLDDPELPMLPGNSAEVYFQTTPKTFFQYVTEPITKFAFKAFKG